MDDLSKQQLILLALLVSFVTSLATGIVTVSLMNQAPTAVTRTVSQVIERTIEQISPQNSNATATLADQSAVAVDTVSGGLVKITSRDGRLYGGLGLLVSGDGVILTDRAALADLTDYLAVFPDGATTPVALVQSQNDGDVVFLAPVAKLSKTYTPVHFGGTVVLGQTVYSLAGTSTLVLGHGVVTQISSMPPAAATSTAGSSQSSSAASVAANPIHTSIDALSVAAGSPLFTLFGDVVGMRTSSLADSANASFYPVSQLKGVIPHIQ